MVTRGTPINKVVVVGFNVRIVTMQLIVKK